jgi:hypothetical protein
MSHIYKNWLTTLRKMIMIEMYDSFVSYICKIMKKMVALLVLLIKLRNAKSHEDSAQFSRSKNQPFKMRQNSKFFHKSYLHI